MHMTQDHTAIVSQLILNDFTGIYSVISTRLTSDSITFIIATMIYRKVYCSLRQEALAYLDSNH